MDDRKLYALYASKNRLCMLCEDITPKKTAYNAYKDANRRVRRAERAKMYAVGDAYRLHTECIQAYKRRKKRNSSFYFFFILPTFIFYCPRLRHSRTPSHFIARLSESGSSPRLAGQKKPRIHEVPDAGCDAVRGDIKAVFRAAGLHYAAWTHSGACGGDPHAVMYTPAPASY